eukprot:m.161001 g.161001  ORF g.161001 m.161001 type:complete len:107 (-) comp23817_c0_seq4:76-396(-)
MTGVCGNSFDVDGVCFSNNHMAATWEEADVGCRGMGARLCTAHELWSNIPKGTGCMGDRFIVWSSTTCPGNTHFAGYGKNPFGNWGVVAGCRASSEGAAIRCCADV